MDHAGSTLLAACPRPAPGRRPVTGPGPFLAVAATMLVVIMGNNVPSPLYGYYQQEWHFSDLTLTAVFAVAAVAVLPTLVLFGTVSDHVGRRLVLLAGCACAAAASAVFILAGGVPSLVLGRLLAGIGIGLVAGTASAALAELEPSGDHERAALAGSVATVSGQAVGPLLAGVLAEYAPAPTVTVFVVDIVLVVAVAVALTRVPETAPVDGWGAVRLRPRLGVPASARGAFGLASLAAFGAFAVMGLVAALGPTLVTDLLHVRNRALGGGVVFLLLALSAVAQLGLRRRPLRWSLVVGPLVLVVGVALILAAAAGAGVAVLAAGTAVAGLGQGLSYLGAQRLLDAHVDAAGRAAAFSTFFIVLYVGTALGALGVGLLGRLVGFLPAVLAVGAGAAVLAAATALVSSRVTLLDPTPPLGTEEHP